MRAEGDWGSEGRLFIALPATLLVFETAPTGAPIVSPNLPFGAKEAFHRILLLTAAELANLLGNLDDIRLTAPGADAGGVGIVATPWPDGAFSGFEGFGDPPTYPNLGHVAGTVWTELAARVAGNDFAANPLRPLPEPATPLGVVIGFGVLGLLRARRNRSGGYSGVILASPNASPIR